jgi:hypothetical protein
MHRIDLTTKNKKRWVPHLFALRLCQIDYIRRYVNPAPAVPVPFPELEFKIPPTPADVETQIHPGHIRSTCHVRSPRFGLCFVYEVRPSLSFRALIPVRPASFPRRTQRDLRN